MAMGKKTTMEVELHQDTVEMLEYAKETYGFRSTSKALRAVSYTHLTLPTKA